MLENAIEAKTKIMFGEYHFAEMLMEEKNNFSHRKKATKQLINYLSEKYGQN